MSGFKSRALARQSSPGAGPAAAAVDSTTTGSSAASGSAVKV